MYEEKEKKVKIAKVRKVATKPADQRYLIEQRWIKNKHRRIERDIRRREKKLRRRAR